MFCAESGTTRQNVATTSGSNPKITEIRVLRSRIWGVITVGLLNTALSPREMPNDLIYLHESMVGSLPVVHPEAGDLAGVVDIHGIGAGIAHRHRESCHRT